MENQRLLSPKLIEKIIKRLKFKGVDKLCPMCGHENFTIENGLIINILQNDSSSLCLSGPGLISVFITCENCGYMAQFSLDTLGIIDEVNKNIKNGVK